MKFNEVIIQRETISAFEKTNSEDGWFAVAAVCMDWYVALNHYFFSGLNKVLSK